MNDYYLSLPGGLAACFKTACNIHAHEEIGIKLHAFIPGLKILDRKPGIIDLTIEHIPSKEPRLEQTHDYIKFYSKTSEEFPEDMYHLLYGATRQLSARYGFYNVHSACVGASQDFSLLIGHSGAGKTTLAQHLVDKHGMKLFSGNKTTIDVDKNIVMRAIAGTAIMTALDAKNKRYAYELPRADYAPGPSAKISKIFLMRVNEGVEEMEILKSPSALHHLYPYFMDAVNADVIVNGCDIFDGSVAPNMKGILVDKLAAVIDRIPVRKISGSIDYMANRVLEL